MNAMDQETKLIHMQCEVWGRWMKENGLTAWPKTTTLGKLMEQGANGASQAGAPPLEMPPLVQQIESKVIRLGVRDRQVFTMYYTEWQPVEALARRLRMRKAEFLNVLRRARWRMQLMMGEAAA
jgi:hypothetical protein